MNDKELLEYAAKAAGIDERRLPDAWPNRFDDDQWNPLIDDGDALRLAVKLNLIVGVYGSYTNVYLTDVSNKEIVCWNSSCNNDPYAATRRAIVRAAAEIGRQA